MLQKLMRSPETAVNFEIGQNQIFVFKIIAEKFLDFTARCGGNFHFSKIAKNEKKRKFKANLCRLKFALPQNLRSCRLEMNLLNLLFLKSERTGDRN